MARIARVLLYLGSLAAVLLTGAFHAARIGHYGIGDPSRLAWSMALVGLLCLSAYGVGLPDLARDRRSAALTAIGATGAAAVAVSVVQLAVGSALLPRFVVFGVPLVLVPWYVLCANLANGRRQRGEQRDRVVAVVDAAESETLWADLAGSPEKPAAVVATLGAGQASSVGRSERALLESVARAGGTVVVLDRRAQSDESIVSQAAKLHESGIRVRTLSLFYEEWLGKLPISELERVGLMFDIGEVHRARYGRLKRLADLVAASLVGVAGLAVLPIVLLGNVAANRGPLLYRQLRVGKNGQVFEMLKFRTMRPGCDVSGRTEVGDPRITPFGRWLRRSHLDELPQVWNILRGDLSIVGPRPEQPQYVADLADKIPFYDLRHRVRPGLTGWAQVKYPYGSSDTDAMEKLQYEFFYLRHQSLTLDARILGRTLRSVVGARGR